MIIRLIIDVWTKVRQSKKLRAFVVGLVLFVVSLVAFLANLPTAFGFINSLIPQHVWKTQFKVYAPSCENSINKPSWTIPDRVKPFVRVQCTNYNGLDIIPSSHASLAEFDLTQINGRSYDQTEVDVQITLTFGNTSDNNTMAGLVIQTPQQGTGGYGLAISSTGYWELDNKNKIANGNIVIPQTVYNLELKADKGKLYGSINGVQVVTSDDTFDSSKSAVGLIIFTRSQYQDGGNPPLATVNFSNFVLSL